MGALYSGAALSTGLAWLFGLNRYVWMGEGEYCDLDSPALIRFLVGIGLVLALAGTIIWAVAFRRLRGGVRVTLAALALLLLLAGAVRYGQAVAAEGRQLASGCGG